MGSTFDTASSEEELTLRAWDGDESAFPEFIRLVASMQPPLRGEFGLTEHDAEDVVAEAIRLFWENRDQYDGKRSLRPYLYRIAQNVARELVTGRRKWQKSRQLEVSSDQAWLKSLREPDDVSDKLSEFEGSGKGIQKVLKQVLDKLPALEFDIITAYARAGDYQLDAATLGMEFGEKYKGGVPIPAGTVRQYKKRAIDKIAGEMRRLGYDLEQAGIL